MIGYVTVGTNNLEKAAAYYDAFRNGAVDVKHLYHTISRRDTVDGSRERVLSASLYTGGKPGF